MNNRPMREAGFLLRPAVGNWDSWVALLENPQVFQPLVREVLCRCGVQADCPIRPLLPATNAVFQAGDYVLKLYAPRESGLNPRFDWSNELRWLQKARSLDLPCPKLQGQGELQDRHLFFYLLLERLPGISAGKVLPTLPPDRAGRIVDQIRSAVDSMAAVSGPMEFDLLSQTLENPDWDQLHPGLVVQMKDLARRQNLEQGVWVHGDLNGENVLVDAGDNIYLIDFADNYFAPPWYSLPSVILELLQGDRRLVRRYRRENDDARFLDNLLRGLSLHDFGADILVRFLSRCGLQAQAVHTVEQLRALLADRLL